MSVPFFDLKRQISNIKPEILKTIESVVDSGAFILGPKVGELESFFSNYIGAKYSVAVASGTDALHLALKAIDIKPGDEVITTPFTFVATVDAIAYCGAKPVFVDIEPNTFNLDPDKVKKSITKKTKAIIPVHLYGCPCQMDVFSDIRAKYGIHIVEDCAQAIGAEFDSKKVGSFGSIGCFSFFPTKNLGCFGDGGITCTNDEVLAENLRMYRGHGSKKTYHYDFVGFNSRLDSIQAAILLVRFNYLNEWTNKRRYNAKLYYDFLNDIVELSLPKEPPNAKHVYNQFTVRLKNREGLFQHLKDAGIGSMVYYPLSLHLQKAFSSLGYKKGDFPETEKAQSEVLSLPIFPELKESEIEEVCTAIKSFYGKS